MLEIDPVLQSRLSKYLTAEDIESLDSNRLVMQKTQRLSSLRKTISSFLPNYVANNEKGLTIDNGKLTPGTFMFADVSGFTALSEKLMERAGPAGTEVLTSVFNDYFATMLEILAKSEGQLLKFAGDALLTFFPAKGDEPSDEVIKAIKAGLRMQRAMRANFQPIQSEAIQRWFSEHDMELTMSIGISQGRLYESLVGNLSKRDHVIMGHLPGEADSAEEAGVRDDVIVPEYIVSTYSHEFEFIHLHDQFYQVVDNLGDTLGDYEFSSPPRRRAKSSFLFGLDDNPVVHLEKELERLENISRFVSNEIVNKLVIGGDHIESENRLATVIFVHFTGFAELLDHWGEGGLEILTVILSRYYGMMQRLMEVHGGVLTRCDPYKLGSRFLITFGAPVAHYDDAERATYMALEMREQLKRFNEQLRKELPDDAHLFPFIKQRLGITQGSVFAGEVGWRQRREYTVMGDDVNLSARLAGKAEFDQIIISQSVFERVAPYFKTVPLEPFKAKGKSYLIQAYDVLGRNRESQSVMMISDTPFVGRDVIMLSMNMVMQQLDRNPRKTEFVGVYGDIGVGKTRVARQLVSAANNMGYRTAWATCTSQNTRKTTWSTLIAQLFDIDTHSNDVNQQQMQLSNALGMLKLGDYKDVILDLLTDAEQPTPQRRAKRSSTSRRLFDKLSSDETTAMNKNDMARFRNEMKKALRSNASRADIPVWDALQFKTNLTDALVKVLETYTAQQKTLLIIDDVHKEHSRALNILQKVANRVDNSRLMILVTYEPLHNFSLDLRKIAVSDLTEQQTYVMACAILRKAHLGERLADFLWRSTSGRALYIESLVENLMTGDMLEETEDTVELAPHAQIDTIPDDVRGLVISRVDQLDSNTRDIVRVAAVLGDTFENDTLATICRIDLASFTPLFKQLLDLQIFMESDGQMYRFRHGVTQQAVYEELSRLQRQKLHMRIADYYLEGEQNEQEIFHAVYHVMKAGTPSRAVSILTSAAEGAEEANKNARALALYEKALEIFPDDDTLIGHVERLQDSNMD